MKEQACCFTGHRRIAPECMESVKNETKKTICALVEQKGVCRFYVGGALGYDTVAAQLLLALREERYPWIRVILTYPFDGFTSRWSRASQKVYQALLPRFDEVVRVCAYSGKAAYLERNRYMVDAAAYCVAYCNQQTGGTAYTLRYAVQKGLTVLRILPEAELP